MVGYSDEWYTPMRVYQPLQPFALDPCAPRFHDRRLAEVNYSLEEGRNGLIDPWPTEPDQLVWCNPPYSDKLPWIERFAAGSSGYFLVPSSTNAKWWQSAIRVFGHVFYPVGRINFESPSGKFSGAAHDSCIFVKGHVAYWRIHQAISEGRMFGCLTTLDHASE